MCDDVIQEGKKKRFWCERSLEDYRFFIYSDKLLGPQNNSILVTLLLLVRGFFLLFSLNAHPDTKNLGVK